MAGVHSWKPAVHDCLAELALNVAISQDLGEDLQRKLHVEGLARADAGITKKRSDRRADLTGFAGERPTRRRQVGMIEDVEHPTAGLSFPC